MRYGKKGFPYKTLAFKHNCVLLSWVRNRIGMKSIIYHLSKDVWSWDTLFTNIIWMSRRGLKACLSIPVSPKYNALSQTTARPNKFNGLQGKQEIAVCRIFFVCFVNKFPPESALTPLCPGQEPVKMLILSLSAQIFNLFSESATDLSVWTLSTVDACTLIHLLLRISNPKALFLSIIFVCWINS